jgi:hypothetical protein
MPKIIIRADAPGQDGDLITLSERLVADNLESGHYAAQLIERLSWAVSDAETLEAHASRAAAPDAGAPRAGASRAAALRTRTSHAALAISLTQ